MIKQDSGIIMCLPNHDKKKNRKCQNRPVARGDKPCAGIIENHNAKREGDRGIQNTCELESLRAVGLVDLLLVLLENVLAVQLLC